MMQDIRARIKKLFDDTGYKAVYLRRDLRFRCDCYSERSGESASNCPKCFGTSYKVSIEPILTRRHPNAVPLSLSGVSQQTPFGNLIPKAFLYYIQYDVVPKEKDMIIEVKWNGDKPVSIIDKHEISFVYPLSGDKGRIEFYQVYCRIDMKGANDDEALTQH